MASLGDSSNDIRRAFESLAASAGLDAVQALEALKTATGNEIAELDLLKAANSALLSGVDITGDQFTELARFLVYEGNDVGAVAYDSLEIDVDHSEFRETDGVPGDAKVIEHTWRYVNKKGGPDRRFTNNPQIPVCRYERIGLRSPTGLNVHLMLSRLGVAQGLRDAEAELVPLKREAPDAEMPRDDAGQRKFEAWIRSQRRTQSAR